MHPNTIRMAAGFLALAMLTACDRTTGGTASETAASSAAASTATTSTTAVTSQAESTEPSAGTHSLPTYGVVETTKRPVSAGEVTCEPDAPPAHPVEARSAAPGSPTVIIGLPDGFTPGAAPQGDVALNLTGPDGITATVTITPTTLDAANAFDKYADDRTKGSPISSLSVLPGDMCGYSGQELMGMLAEEPGRGIQYGDRLVHVWTNDGDFLIAVAVQAPDSGPALDAAKSVLLEDFGIRMP